MRGCPLLAPVVVSSSRGAPANCPPTLPPFARNSSITWRFQSFMACCVMMFSFVSPASDTRCIVFYMICIISNNPVVAVVIENNGRRTIIPARHDFVQKTVFVPYSIGTRNVHERGTNGYFELVDSVARLRTMAHCSFRRWNQ